MDIEIIDRDMAHVILSAFSVASHEGLSSLVENPIRPERNKPHGNNYAKAELKTLRLINKMYPDIVAQYFDIEKQRM